MSKIDPQVSFASGKTNLESRDAEGVIKDALNRLNTRPNFAIICHSTLNENITRQEFTKLFPPDTAVISIQARDIQVNNVNDVSVSCDQDMSVLLGSFPDAICCPFYLNQEVDLTASIKHQLIKHSGEKPKDYWKAFFICVASYYPPEAVKFEQLQKSFPSAVVFGGVCHVGAISKQAPIETWSIKELKMIIELSRGQHTLAGLVSKDELLDIARNICNNQCPIIPINEGIFGIAFGGNVPLKCCVTRGVEKGTSIDCRVSEAVEIKPGHKDYPLSCEGNESLLPSFQKITKIDILDPNKQAVITGSINDFKLLFNAEGHQGFQYLGVKKQNSPGYVLEELSNFTFLDSSIWIESETSVIGSNINLFQLNPAKAMCDLDATLQRLHQELSEKNEKLMGAMMISCCGRGPFPGRTTPVEAMPDASMFRQYFGTLPLLGFYAYGEIGPKPVAEAEYGIFQFGNVALQSYTAVFGIFVTPKREAFSANLYKECEAGIADIKRYFLCKK